MCDYDGDGNAYTEWLITTVMIITCDGDVVVDDAYAGNDYDCHDAGYVTTVTA